MKLKEIEVVISTAVILGTAFYGYGVLNEKVGGLKDSFNSLDARLAKIEDHLINNKSLGAK